MRTPGRSGSGLYSPGYEIVKRMIAVFRSCKNSSLPAANTFLDQSRDRRWPSFRMQSTDSATPTASHVSKTPTSQPNPHLMALSISTIVSAISGIRFAEYRNVRDIVFQRNWPTRSSPQTSLFIREAVSSFCFAASSEGNFDFAPGLVFKRIQIEDSARGISVSSPRYLLSSCKLAAFGFVAEQFPLQHLADKIEESEKPHDHRLHPGIAGYRFLLTCTSTSRPTRSEVRSDRRFRRARSLFPVI